MRIRKFASGGEWAVFLLSNKSSAKTPSSNFYSSTKKKKTEESESTSGELTEKAFYDMIKGIDALPNELDKITGKILGILKLNELTGIDTLNLELRYVEILHDITQAKRNKDLFDEAYKNARTDLSLDEIAILPGGLVAVFDKNQNKFDSIPVNTFLESIKKGVELLALTVSNLAFFRAYDPNFFKANSLFYNPDEVFNIMNSNMSTKKFQEYLDQAKVSLGNMEITSGNVLLLNAKIGLEQILNMSQGDINRLLDNIGSDTYAQETIKEGSNMQAITSLFLYMVLTLPEEAKVWALLKTGIENPNDAAGLLVKLYLDGQLKTVYDNSITFHNTSGSSNSSGSGSAGNAEDDINKQKAGFWQLLYIETSGNSNTMNLTSGKTSMIVGGRLYSNLPNIEGPKSLHNYIYNSGLSYMISDNNKITFGSLPIDPSAMDDILVDDKKGVMVVALPVDANGMVDFQIFKEYEEITTQLIRDGKEYGTKEYERALAEKLREHKDFNKLLDPDTGLPSKLYFKRFIILPAYMTENAKVKVGNDIKNIKDAISELKLAAKDNPTQIVDPEDWIRESKDKTYTDMVQEGLSSKDNKYKYDNHGMFGSASIYIGSLFIPLTDNSLNAGLADNNIPTVGEAQSIYNSLELQDQTVEKVKTNNNRQDLRTRK